MRDYIINIIIGVFFGSFIATVLARVGSSSICGFLPCLGIQTILGFLLSLPVLIIMWKRAKKINNKYILFFGSLTMLISGAISFYIVTLYIMMTYSGFDMRFVSVFDLIYKETPYILLAFILFFFLIQVAMYNTVSQKKSNDKK